MKKYNYIPRAREQETTQNQHLPVLERANLPLEKGGLTHKFGERVKRVTIVQKGSDSKFATQEGHGRAFTERCEADQAAGPGGASSDMPEPAAAVPDDKASRTCEYDEETLRHIIEERLIEAVWTLRRLPDHEHGWLYARQSLWPETMEAGTASMPVPVSNLLKKLKTRPSPIEIDRMLPALDLLTLLPDLEDRRIIFWGAWHQEGEKMDKVPWMKVGRSLNSGLSRWSLKRRYRAALRWITVLVLV